MRAAAAACVLAACAAGGYDPPDWVRSPPLDETYLYGLGSYVGALHSEDNQLHAMDQARGMLSRNLRSRVVSDTLTRDDERRSSGTSEVLVSADYVLEHSELVSTWVDRRGHTGRPGTVWVLMRIRRQ